ncbi:MAG: AMP-binding protein [Pseudomonadales bacterium]
MLNRESVLPWLIEARAHKTPHKVFLQMIDGDQMTYAELHREGLRWAAALTDAGVVFGDRVATLLPKSFTAVAVWLGAAWNRAIEVSINLEFRDYMLRYVINHSQANVLVIHEIYLDRVLEVMKDLGHVQHIIVVGKVPDDVRIEIPLVAAAQYLRPPDRDHFIGPGAQDIAMMLYTSGTTGPSKGVLIPWAQSHASARLWPYREGTRLYSVFPLFHVTGRTPLYAMALANGTLIMRERFSAQDFWSDVTNYECTAANLMAAPILYLENMPESDVDADNPLEFITTGRLPKDPNGFMKRFGVTIGTSFNMTEISPAICSDGKLLANNSSCGRVRNGYQVRVVDEQDRPLAPNEDGELVVRADDPWVLMAGYWDMPEKTVEAWRNLWFHTGDVFRYDEDGNFYYVDRLKDAIRRRGENISSFEVEAIVTDHPSVAECAAVAANADSEDEVMILVVLTPGKVLSEEELCRWLIPKMPRFMIPRYIEFVEQLPKTASLKVQKAVLRERGVTKRTWDREHAGLSIPRS